MEPADLPVRSGGQVTYESWVTRGSAQLSILIVDDAASEEAGDLRGAVLGALRAGLHQLVEERWGGCGSPDPALDHPSDERFLVVLPSAPDGLAMLGPVDVPGLAWLTTTSQHHEVEPVVEAARNAMSSRLASGGEPHRPLRAARRATELVLGFRAPENEAENALLGALAPDAYVRVLIASTRDDEGTEPVVSLADSWSAMQQTDRLHATTVLGPFGVHGGTCDAWDSKSPTRLSAWANLVHTQMYSWPCDWENTWENLLGNCCCDGAPACLSRPVSTLPSGAGACRVWVDQEDLARCDPAKGWSDPGGVPTFVDDMSPQLRRCEVAELAGSWLSACQHSLACEGCPPGWCLTAVSELLVTENCVAGKYPSPFRFIGSAMTGARRQRIQCDVIPAGN